MSRKLIYKVLIVGILSVFALSFMDGVLQAAEADKVKHKAKISEVEVREIYSNLLKHTGLTNNAFLPLQVIKSNQINAYTDGNVVAIYTGMLDFVQSKDEIAAVLGHEIGHVMLEHVYSPLLFASSILEGNADKYGAYLMLRAGYDVCKAKDLWERLRNASGDFEFTSSHPNYSYRYWELDFPICH